MRTARSPRSAPNIWRARIPECWAISARGVRLTGNVRLLDHLFDFDEIRVHSRRPESRNAFAERLTHDLGKPVTVTEDWQSCVEGADIVVEASRLDVPTPVLKTAWIKPGALVIPYGTMSAVELSLTDIMAKIVVDGLGQCKGGKFGSLRAHVETGRLSEATLHAETGADCRAEKDRAYRRHRGPFFSGIAACRFRTSPLVMPCWKRLNGWALGSACGSPETGGNEGIGTMTTISIGERRSSAADIAVIAREGATVGLCTPALQRIAEGYEALVDLVQAGKPIYGVTNGIGRCGRYRAWATRISLTSFASHWPVRSGSVGTASAEEVRAMMAARLCRLAQGYSGISPAAADSLMALLNARIHPVTPMTGSLGEADLAPPRPYCRGCSGRG